jgi:G3E family GTPase
MSRHWHQEGIRIMSTKAARVRATGSPIYVIAGFLGSGKTTLLKRALAHELDRGVKPAVLMNEFGQVDVDGAVLHEHPRSKDIQLQSLLSGCICCDLSGEFSDKVWHLVRHSGGAPVFIETTGLADTGQVVTGVERALSSDAQIGVAAHLASVIVLVDAPRFLKLGAYWPAADRHLCQADTIILNKLDQIAPDQAPVVEQRIRAANPTARVLRAVHADVKVPQLLNAAPARRAPVVTDGVIKDSAVGYQSGSFRLTFPVDPARMEAWLKRYARSVVRLKGFIRVAGKTGFHEVQWILGSFSVTPYIGRRQSHAKIVLIGRRVAWQRFLEGLEHCLVRPRRRVVRRRPAGKRVSQ